uniref:Uncharacterized protein n=1 Tax=Micrurus corallinus TaxID=54390 RepID=A0A2D4F6R0_MICCO
MPFNQEACLNKMDGLGKGPISELSPPLVSSWLDSSVKSLCTELVQLPILMPNNDEFSKGTPNCTGNFGLAAGDLHVRFTVLKLAGVSKVKEAHKTLVAHLLICRKHDDIPSKVKATSPHS